jgi:hypothetical protein
VSYPAGVAIERAGRCLRCDGEMVLNEPAAEDRTVPRAESDASQRAPNGLEDDAET